ncbi:MAG: zeta toxin family protein [Planctomycetes bacterium]|nr:zeta toxin family protein [Planctomycetota bacterium]
MAVKVAYIIAGPNGSGKTTFVQEFIKQNLLPFLNADEIALKLSPHQIAKARIQAGKIFLSKIGEHIAGGKSFIIETTLAGRYFIGVINELRKNNYRIEIIYIFVESIEEAIRRVDIRVKKGGHPVPEEDIKRRFTRSKVNFWNMYRPMADNWRIFLNSKDEFLQVATGEKNELQIIDEVNFSLFKESVV